MSFDKKIYDQQFARENYDRIPLNVKKGDKAKIADCARKKGYNSITEYIKDLIMRDMSENENRM